ncbi:GNAT family N-acetyltransferase [Nocardioides mangrovi]|uniref:GNAT family N-acetyltransferase n=1 Tax=Nocardioides mangrovi TaxID=2874580 RepID=A0ABS7U8A6_9ACTN|nr:GNAT family protein [Nocardioides mangrovi]MBZ5737201.1 GNAT family N-acetyltransferase [Nocardioides mangrovi]
MPSTNAFGQPVGDVVPEWTPRPWPVATRLEGRYVALEPLSVDHAADLHAALCGPGDHDLWTYRPTEPPADVPAMAALVEATLAPPDWETFAIVPAGAAPQGMLSFMRIEPAHGQVEVAGVLHSHALQRTTAATEAVHLALRHAFDELGYRRFEWKCDSLNEPSRRAATRLGFSYEGRFRHHLVTKGRNRDTDWFSITDTEWPAVRAAHEAWLDPANFDADGRQLTPLSPPARSARPATR